MTDDCPIAPTLPTTIVTTASVANAGAHSVGGADQRAVEQPDHDPNAAAFVATAMNAVIGVGAPS